MCLIADNQSSQIDKFVEHGMPKKIVKTIENKIRKRVEEYNNDQASDEDTLTAINESEATMLTENQNRTPLAENPNDSSATIEKEMKIPKLCGRFRKLQNQNKNNINQKNGSGASVDNGQDNNEKVYVDILSTGTALTKQVFESFNRALQHFQNTKSYTVLTKTTQPAHVIVICIFSFVLLTLWRDLFDNSRNEKKLNSMDGSPAIVSKSTVNAIVVIAYLAAFATRFGSQIWMTFVSGLSLYFSLPRHTFGQCQQILFPKYFALNGVLSIGMLILYVKYFLSSWETMAGWTQLIALAVTAVIEVIVRLYLAPPMLRLMHEKYSIEDAIGSGQEVGSIVQGDLVQCPHYQRIHKAFRRIHIIIAIGNMVTLLVTFLHLYFLASKIQIQIA